MQNVGSSEPEDGWLAPLMVATPIHVVSLVTRQGTTQQPADQPPATAIHASPSARIGVDTTALVAAVDAVRDESAAGQFQFYVRHEWLDGTHSRSTIVDHSGVGANNTLMLHISPRSRCAPAGVTGGARAPRRVDVRHGVRRRRRSTTAAGPLRR